MNNKKILRKSIKALDNANKIAFENRDAELLVAISDRWYALIEQDKEEHQPHRLGFVIQEESNDHGATKHKRKS